MTEERRRKLRLAADRTWVKAVARYNARYNEVLYEQAVRNLSYARRQRLLADALALCGDPFNHLSRVRWGEDALAFLESFVTE